MSGEGTDMGDIGKSVWIDKMRRRYAVLITVQSRLAEVCSEFKAGRKREAQEKLKELVGDLDGANKQGYSAAEIATAVDDALNRLNRLDVELSEIWNDIGALRLPPPPPPSLWDSAHVCAWVAAVSTVVLAGMSVVAVFITLVGVYVQWCH